MATAVFLPRVATARFIDSRFGRVEPGADSAGILRGLPLEVYLAGRIVSKQDTHFINVFSLVIGLLVVVALALFALARAVAGHTQDKDVYAESAYIRSVDQRLQPLSREAVAGQDNSAIAIVETKPAGQAGSALPVPKTGTEVFEQVCSACHAQGIAGAPKAGDVAAWGPRIAKGKPTLYDHALHGFQGQTGVMPAKGGRTDVPDDLIRAAVDHMVELAQKH